MSTQRGNIKKKGQKHQNTFAFKNDLHDKTKKAQILKNLNPGGVCQRCKDILDWKIKYKKYKPLTQAKTCTKCKQKTVKQAYFSTCVPCALKLEICGKCGEKTELVGEPEKSLAEQMSEQSQFEAELEMMPERKKRTFLRLQAQGKLTDLDQEEDDESEDNLSDDLEDFTSDSENFKNDGSDDLDKIELGTKKALELDT